MASRPMGDLIPDRAKVSAKVAAMIPDHVGVWLYIISCGLSQTRSSGRM